MAKIVADALQYFEGERYHLFAWCIMPNHVHIVLQVIEQDDLPNIVRSWKSFTAREANGCIDRKGPFWQKECYDHIIRDEQEFWHAIRYTWENPDKAGFKSWKWRWHDPIFSLGDA